jgi:hypothetical protein
MEKHQTHFGKKFYKDTKTGYWISSQCPKIRAHRWVWEYHNGKIPKGFHIHHKDENKSNNSIENLQIIHQKHHLSLHSSKKKNRERMKKLADENRHLTKEWHASAEGLAWHKYHAEKFKFGKWEPKKYNCEQCQTEYETSKRSNMRFCSNNCKSAWRRKSGLDDISRICVCCGKEFLVNKYSKIKKCSKNCLSNLREKHIDEIIALRKSGYTYAYISEKLGMTRKDVSLLEKKSIETELPSRNSYKTP